MSTTPLTEMETCLSRLETAKSRPVLIGSRVAGIGSIAPTNRPASEVRTFHLIIVDNHGKILTETEGIDDEIYIKKIRRRPRNKRVAPRHSPGSMMQF
jgi:hypothetical protein